LWRGGGKGLAGKHFFFNQWNFPKASTVETGPCGTEKNIVQQKEKDVNIRKGLPSLLLDVRMMERAEKTRLEIDAKSFFLWNQKREGEAY